MGALAQPEPVVLRRGREGDHGAQPRGAVHAAAAAAAAIVAIGLSFGHHKQALAAPQTRHALQ